MRSSILPLALFLAGAITAAAQEPQSAPRHLPSANLYVLPQEQPCSIAAMHATQGSSSQMLQTDDGKSVPVMRPRLTLTPKNGKTILSATITAHGYPATPGSMNLVAQAVPAGHHATSREISRTVQIKFEPAEGGAFAAELSLPGFSAVTRIGLNSLTYSDGSTWKVAARNDCQIAPDPLLLISTR